MPAYVHPIIAAATLGLLLFVVMEITGTLYARRCAIARALRADQAEG